MHITAAMIRRELIDQLAERHLALRTTWPAGPERERFDRLATLTVHRAKATVDIYELEPFPERLAIGSMYAACEVGLELLRVLEDPLPPGADRALFAFTVRDLRSLICELFEYVIAPGGEPILELEK